MKSGKLFCSLMTLPKEGEKKRRKYACGIKYSNKENSRKLKGTLIFNCKKKMKKVFGTTGN